MSSSAFAERCPRAGGRGSGGGRRAHPIVWLNALRRFEGFRPQEPGVRALLLMAVVSTMLTVPVVSPMLARMKELVFRAK